MSIGRAIGNVVERMLIPDGNSERMIFRRFPGYVLKKAAKGQTSIDTSKVDTVILNINPAQIAFSKRKVIQKVQTSAPGRFIVFDWGSELTVMSMSGNTGNLLPDSVTNGVNPLGGMLSDLAGIVPSDTFDNDTVKALTQSGAADKTAAVVQNSLMSNLGYFELIEMSPKFKTFKKLEKMYDIADADNDVLTLEVGSDDVYRGFFEDFSFEVTAESPWNWKYSITFIILADLNATITRWDEQYNDEHRNIISRAEESD